MINIIRIISINTTLSFITIIGIGNMIAISHSNTVITNILLLIVLLLVLMSISRFGGSVVLGGKSGDFHKASWRVRRRSEV